MGEENERMELQRQVGMQEEIRPKRSIVAEETGNKARRQRARAMATGAEALAGGEPFRRVREMLRARKG